MIHKKQCERSRASRKKRCKTPGKVKEKSVNSRMKREEQKKIIIYAVCKFFNKKSVQIVEADSHISD